MINPDLLVAQHNTQLQEENQRLKEENKGLQKRCEALVRYVDILVAHARRIDSAVHVMSKWKYCWRFWPRHAVRTAVYELMCFLSETRVVRDSAAKDVFDGK